MCLSAAGQQHRAPATPLVTNDPFFSLWSMGDKLTDVPVKHWTEVAQPMLGLIRIDGTTYRWMGTMPRGYFGMPAVEAMQQVSVEVTPLHSKYRFTAGGLELGVTFFTPLFPKDLDVMSRPVTYLSWSARSIDGKQHQADLMLDVDPLIAVDQPRQQVTWSRSRAPGLTLLNVGSRDQQTLHQSGDRVRIDWGYFRLAVPDSALATTSMAYSGVPTFVTSGNLPDTDDSSMPLPAAGRERAAHLSTRLPLGLIGASRVERHVELAYTEGYAIEYLGRRLRPYWQRNGMTEAVMLATAEKEYAQLEERGERFDADTTAQMEKIGGPDYRYLTSLLFRQTIAAHKLVADVDGTPMFFSKENDSNGCIDTVDVTYPSSPFFLLFNPKLLEAQLEPLMRYAALPRWRFPFAPHDLGTYPLANGQVYGGGEENEEDQMPVEESGNLIIMVAALERREENWEFAKRYMPQLKQWADYLEKKGMDPENQLSTDDFAGHLAHNTNLSIKAIEALGAFVQIARGVGDTELADRYERIVSRLPEQWEKMAIDGDHYKLAFDQPGTWSQKYNLVWDDLLDLHLFPKRVMNTEWDFYSRQMKQYGLPLDNRKTITKLDWEVWTASLASKPEQFQDLIHRLVVWADETPSRTPTTDFYDTVSGKEIAFQARSVVGGVFIKALMHANTKN
ncbi:glutaminase family protein [Edaphobacter modestus]|nr:glutaminase family protein [Edaphobacter modestus]